MRENRIPSFASLLTLATLAVALINSASAAEFRGLWVDTFHPGMRSAAEIDRLISDARAGNLNALIVQVRRRGDAFYNGQFEPRAFDVSPQSFDPLAYLIEHAHDATGGPRLEVHAWMVTYPIWDRRNAQPRQADHPYRLHPEWLTRNIEGEMWSSAGYAFDPGHPEVQEHTFNVAMDILANYDVDGLNLDYIRYDGLSWGYNPVSVERFNQATGRTGVPAPSDSDWMQWRRDQVTGLVRRIYLGAAVIHPQAAISADTICFAPGVTELRGWLRASNAYTSVLQDWRGWMEEGILDLNIPMTYFDADGNHMESWLNWNRFIKDHRYGRHAAIGIGSYLNSITNTLSQIVQTRMVTEDGPAANGQAIYSYAAPALDESLEFNELIKALIDYPDENTEPLYAVPVPTPEMPWKTTPILGHLKGTLAMGGNAARSPAETIRVDGPGGSTFVVVDPNGFFGLANTQPGAYRLIASRDGFMPFMTNVLLGAGTTVNADLILDPLPPATAPVVALQPEDDEGFFGEPVRLQSIGAASTPVSYQWYFGNTPLTGETNSTLAFPSVDFDVAGRYALVMSNDFGAVTSEVAQVTVKAPEGIYAVNASAGYDSAVVSWRTSERGDARVLLGAESNVVQLVYLPESPSTNHAIRIAGLSPNTTYAFSIHTTTATNELQFEGHTLRTAGDVVVDNTDAAFSGGWTTGTSADGRYGNSYRFAGTTRGKASSTAVYRPALPTPGRYDIDIWHPHGSNRSQKTPHVITYDLGSLTNAIDQTRNGGRWQQLAADLPMHPENGNGVRISNDTGEYAKVVIADAVRFDYLPEQDLPDENSIPLWWTSHFFRTKTTASADPDGDLYTNREEYLLGSNPRNGRSSVIVWSRIDDHGQLHIQFVPMQPDRDYHLEFTVDLENPLWKRQTGAVPFVGPDFRGGFSTLLPDDMQVIFRVVAEVPLYGPLPAGPVIEFNRM